MKELGKFVLRVCIVVAAIVIFAVVITSITGVTPLQCGASGYFSKC
jgi:hypothetical protein